MINSATCMYVITPATPLLCKSMLKYGYFITPVHPLPRRSMLMYDYEEVPDSPFRIEDAMALYGLTDFELIWDRTSDTKALLAWGGDVVVLGFRGTASMTNVLTDLKVGSGLQASGSGSLWVHAFEFLGFTSPCACVHSSAWGQPQRQGACWSCRPQGFSRPL